MHRLVWQERSLLAILFGEDDTSSGDKRSLPPLSSDTLRKLPTSVPRLSWDLDMLALSSTELMQIAAATFYESGVMK